MSNKFYRFLLLLPDNCDTHKRWWNVKYAQNIRFLNSLFLSRKRHRIRFTKKVKQHLFRTITTEVKTRGQGCCFYVGNSSASFSVLALKGLFTDSTSAAISEKTGTREWDKTDTPPTTITLETIRTSAAIFRRVGICA